MERSSRIQIIVTTGTLVAELLTANQLWLVKPSSHLTGRDGTRRKDRREATGRSDGVLCEHQEWERNRTTVQIGQRREELDRSNFSYRRRASTGTQAYKNAANRM